MGVRTGFQPALPTLPGMRVRTGWFINRAPSLNIRFVMH